MVRPLAAAHALVVLLFTPATPVLHAQGALFGNDFEGDAFGRWSDAVGHVDHLAPRLVEQSTYYSGVAAECPPASETVDWSGAFATIDPATVRPGVRLDFAVEVHVEPHVQYATAEAFYARGRADLVDMGALFAARRARLTVEVQPPFTDVAQARGDDVLADLVALGHEVGVHFHEEAHLGPAANSRPVGDWTAVLGELRAQAEALSGSDVTAWSGGNVYGGALAASAAAGLAVKSGFKDPATQRTAAAAVTVTPYFPGAWGSADALLVPGDGSGVLFVPTGVFPLHCTGPGSLDDPVSPAPFDFLTRALAASLDAATPLAAQAMSVVWHANGFRVDRTRQIALWARYLDEVLQPLVDAGVLRYATLREIAAAVAADR